MYRLHSYGRLLHSCRQQSPVICTNNYRTCRKQDPLQQYKVCDFNEQVLEHSTTSIATLRGVDDGEEGVHP